MKAQLFFLVIIVAVALGMTNSSNSTYDTEKAMLKEIARGVIDGAHFQNISNLTQVNMCIDQIDDTYLDEYRTELQKLVNDYKPGNTALEDYDFISIMTDIIYELLFYCDYNPTTDAIETALYKMNQTELEDKAYSYLETYQIEHLFSNAVAMLVAKYYYNFGDMVGTMLYLFLNHVGILPLPKNTTDSYNYAF